MTAREYLDQIRVLDARIDVLLQEKKVIRESILPGSISYRDKVQNSPDPDPYGTWVCRMEEKEAEIAREIDALYDLKLEVTRTINQLQDARYIRVLYARYVELKKFRVIADEIGYTCQYTRIIHKDALKMFEKTFNKIQQHFPSEV